MMVTGYHIPVLLEEAIEGLAIQPDGIYVDTTFGGGGHAQAILNKLENGHLVAFDKDEEAKANEIQDQRFTLIQHDFAFMKNFLEYLELVPVHGILADLGVASHQFDEASRGFTYRSDAKLDMRMDTDHALTAAYILNHYDPQVLQTIFGQYGEIKNAKQLAFAIDQHRKAKPFETTDDLVKVVDEVRHGQDKEMKYLGQVFQALRIEVNGELKALERLLKQSTEVMIEGGRLVIITYHSLEDRLVKNFLRTGNFKGKATKDLYGNIHKPFEQVNRKPIQPKEEEISQNRRAKSAQLRIGKKIEESNVGN